MCVCVCETCHQHRSVLRRQQLDLRLRHTGEEDEAEDEEDPATHTWRNHEASGGPDEGGGAGSDPVTL